MGAENSKEPTQRGGMTRSHTVVVVSQQQGVMYRAKPRPPAVPVSSGPYPSSYAPNYLTSNKQSINNDLLERFLVVQAEIAEHNSEGVFEGLQSVQEEFEALLKEKKQADVNYRVLQEQCNKEKQDYDNITSPTVQAYFRSKQDHERAIAKEKLEYLESVKNVEKAEEELKKVTAKYQAALNNYNKYQAVNKKAIDLFNEQMNILYSTYEGAEGSELENDLEARVKNLEEQKEILKSALNKWSNSRFLLVYAYNQLQCSEIRWKDLMKMDLKNPEKVIPATEVRNNLIAANQNLINTKAYLKNVTFPYCTDEDLKSLQALAGSTYQDMLSQQRQQYFLSIIQALSKRCYNLNQWFDQVIKSTLVVDYSNVLKELSEKHRDLRNERIRLLTEKIKNATGKDVNVELFNVVPEKNITENDTVLEKVNSDANKIKKELKEDETINTTDNKPIADNDQPIEKNDQPVVAEDTDEQGEKFNMPPPPSMDQILGDIEEIKARYREQTEGWNKHLDDSRREADERLQKLLAQHSK